VLDPPFWTRRGHSRSHGDFEDRYNASRTVNASGTMPCCSCTWRPATRPRACCDPMAF
jgi:hypothetical protein